MPGININLPIEIQAGEFATSMQVQGEIVTYKKINVPVECSTADLSGAVTFLQMSKSFMYKEDADQTKVTVDLSGNDIDGLGDGKHVLKKLIKDALLGKNLRAIDVSGVVYADGSDRNTSASGAPIRYYVKRDVSGGHIVGLNDVSGAPIEAYLKEYLYDNLSAAIGLAATTGTIDVTLSRDISGGGNLTGSQTAAEIIAELLARQIAGETHDLSTANDDVVNAAIAKGKALRQTIYEQMFVLAPDRFKTAAYTISGDEILGNIMNKPGYEATNDIYKMLPFQANDTLSFLVTFKFPASKITAPILQHALTLTDSGVYAPTGEKITVTTPSSNTLLPGTTLNDFPPCTVLLRTKLAV